MLEFIGEGRNRRVYKHKGYVVKIPINEYGLADNEFEAQTFKKWHKEFPYARCRMVGVCLVMEYVEHTFEKKLPEWTMSVDCGQVGYNRDGKLLAYDYGRF